MHDAVRGRTAQDDRVLRRGAQEGAEGCSADPTGEKGGIDMAAERIDHTHDAAHGFSLYNLNNIFDYYYYIPRVRLFQFHSLFFMRTEFEALYSNNDSRSCIRFFSHDQDSRKLRRFFSIVSKILHSSN